MVPRSVRSPAQGEITKAITSENNGERSPDGNGPHVRSHQASHKGHGQDGRYYRQCRQSGGVPYFVHGLDSDLGQRPTFVLR
jgi:hypothetical protein